MVMETLATLYYGTVKIYYIHKNLPVFLQFNLETPFELPTNFKCLNN